MRNLSDRTIGQWLEYWASHTPDKEFIVYSDLDMRWTYSQFNKRVDNLAKGLLSIGVKKGTHVGIWASNVPDWNTMFFACSKIGAITIAVNTNFKQYEIEEMVRRSDMEVLCIIEHERDNNFMKMTHKMLPELTTCEKGQINSAAFPTMKAVIYLGTMQHRGMYTTNELMMMGLTLGEDIYQKAKNACDCMDPICIQFTSGTTGFPKGAILSHYGMCNNGYLGGVYFNFMPDTKLCICLPLYHCFGLVSGILNCLTHGCTVVILKRFDSLLVLASIHKERCTSLYGVPTMYISILNHPMFNLFDLSSLQVGVMAGSLCPVPLMKEVEKKMHLTIVGAYGLTEATSGLTTTRTDDPFEIRCTTVGRAKEHTEVKVIAPDGNECPIGDVGEICSRGFSTMIGYYKAPEATAELVDKNRWLHTGDLGFKDKNGNFHITGRIKDIIIRGGENIYPTEIEAFLQRMPEIRMVQVVGVPSKKYGESVGAFIILNPGCHLEEVDVREFCEGQIARYKIPKYIFFVNDYPLMGNGKVQKNKLREMSLELCKKKGIEVI